MKYTDEQLIAFLENDLDDETNREIAEWIRSSNAAQRRIEELQILERVFSDSLDFDPPAEMLYSFRERLLAEKRESGGVFRWYQIAAAILLVIAGFVTGRLTPEAYRPEAELGELKHEVSMLQQMVMINTLRSHTASERLQAINTMEQSSKTPDAKLIDTLLQSMNNDESPNVRYAAVEALGRYINKESVRVEMVHSLGEQDNPMVQIAMINLLMKAEDKAAIAPIKKLVDNNSSPPEVRHTAEFALNILI
jgi:hypothetical protein